MGRERFSVELCGGPHAERTGDLGLFQIQSESGIAAGVRRIEAVTGEQALAYVDQQQQELENSARLLKAPPLELSHKVQQLMSQQKQLEKDVAGLQSKLAAAASGDLLSQVQTINGVSVLAVNLEGVDAKSLRDTADQLRNKMGSGVILLATVAGDKVTLLASVTKDLTQQYKAGDLMRLVAPIVGGKGGGRPDTAQGGGDQPENLDKALEAVFAWVKEL
jgi:alanyl-tRNA synthetase